MTRFLYNVYCEGEVDSCCIDVRGLITANSIDANHNVINAKSINCDYIKNALWLMAVNLKKARSTVMVLLVAFYRKNK